MTARGQRAGREAAEHSAPGPARPGGAGACLIGSARP